MNSPDYDEIIPNLFLGNLESTKDYRFLKLKNIKYVLSITKNDVRLDPSEYKHIHFSLRDAPYEDLISIFDICHSFIEEGLRKGLGVLVHCNMGISRSSTIVISYLMRKMKRPFSEVYRFVKRRRPQVGPNFGFQAQLLLFDKMNFNRNSDSIYNKLYRQFLLSDNTTGEQKFDVKNYIAFIAGENDKEQLNGNSENFSVTYKPPIPYEGGCGDGYKSSNNQVVHSFIKRNKRRL